LEYMIILIIWFSVFQIYISNYGNYPSEYSKWDYFGK
jgi:hypothetical protein